MRPIWRWALRRPSPSYPPFKPKLYQDKYWSLFGISGVILIVMASFNLIVISPGETWALVTFMVSLGYYGFVLWQFELIMDGKIDVRADYLSRLFYRNCPHVDLWYPDNGWALSGRAACHGIKEKYGWVVYEDEAGPFVLSRILADDDADYKIYLRADGIAVRNLVSLEWRKISGDCPLFEENDIHRMLEKIR